MGRSGHAAFEDNLANVVEALDMFIGGPGIGCDGADPMVGLSYDIEGQRPIFAETETFSRCVCQFT